MFVHRLSERFTRETAQIRDADEPEDKQEGAATTNIKIHLEPLRRADRPTTMIPIGPRAISRGPVLWSVCTKAPFGSRVRIP